MRWTEDAASAFRRQWPTDGATDERQWLSRPTHQTLSAWFDMR